MAMSILVTQVSRSDVSRSRNRVHPQSSRHCLYCSLVSHIAFETNFSSCQRLGVRKKIGEVNLHANMISRSAYQVRWSRINMTHISIHLKILVITYTNLQLSLIWGQERKSLVHRFVYSERSRWFTLVSWRRRRHLEILSPPTLDTPAINLLRFALKCAL